MLLPPLCAGPTLARGLPAATRVALLVLLLASLPVHAAEPARPGRPYAGRTACCQDPAEFHYLALPDHGRLDFDIDARSPLFEFQSGYSAFAAFRLPVRAEPYLLEVRSYLRGGPDPLRARVLYPLVALLSDDFLVMRSVGLDAATPELPVQERSGDPAYRLSIPVDPLRGHERYLVIYTPYALVAPDRRPERPESIEMTRDVAREAFLGASAEGHLSITVGPGQRGAVAR